MNKKGVSKLLIMIFIILVVLLLVYFIVGFFKKSKVSVHDIKATILYNDDVSAMIMDFDNNIYVIPSFSSSVRSGDNLVIKYTGIIDDAHVVSYENMDVERDDNGIPISWKDDGIFSDYYVMAYNKLKTLSLNEKIGQLLLARYSDINALDDLKKYYLSGFVFFEKDFKDKTKLEVQSMIKNLQNGSSIPLITAVDEEGGKVVRVSSNPNLVSSRFASPRELYLAGGMNKIKEDTINKSKVLSELGLNLNLAPVVDVSNDENDYMYARTIGEDTETTSLYAKTVIEASRGLGVSYTLKHFPGYGNNSDTHTGSSVDNRSYESIMSNDIPPFEAGIKALAPAVLVSHNIVNSIDSSMPASLSSSVHNLLRTNLKFTGVTITDDISMSALNGISDKTLKAVLAGNDLIITTDYAASFNELKMAVEDGSLDESIIDRLVFRVLAFKYYSGLMLQLK